MPTLAPISTSTRKPDRSSAPERPSLSANRTPVGSAAGLPLFLQRCWGGAGPAPIQCTTADAPTDQNSTAAVRALRSGAVINQPGDRFEREADTAAAEALAVSPRSVSGAQIRPVSSRSPRVTPPDPGHPLAPDIRARAEPIVGADLGAVRVHESAEARQQAAAVQAHAFTHENHIWLGPGQRADDVGLMTHEAAHVAQQTSGAPTAAVQRQPWGPFMQPQTMAGAIRRPVIIDEVVELQGQPEFNPSTPLATHIDRESPESVDVRVRFGTLASGVVRVRKVLAHGSPPPTLSGAMPPRSLYETVGDQAYMTLNHPALPGDGSIRPIIHFQIRNSFVTGHVGYYGLEPLLGLKGLSAIHPAAFVNELRNGILRFELRDFAFQLQNEMALGDTVVRTQDGLPGKGNFVIQDATQDFQAETIVSAPGINEERMTLRRIGGKLIGHQNFTLTLQPVSVLDGKFSGTLRGSYADGILTIVGNARYTSKRINGTVTMMLAPRAVAWEHVVRQLPKSANAPQVTTGAATQGGYVIVGWGTVDFAFNEWLNGSVSVVVDPDGYITTHGILRPTKEFEFLTEREKYSAKRRLVDPIEKTVGFALAFGVGAEVGGHVSFELWGGGRVGPARIYGIEFEGTYSTRPGSVFEARATARANLSAWASLEAKITGGLHFSIVRGGVGRVVNADLEIIGSATLRAYAEIQPTLEKLAAKTPGESDFKLSGRVEVAGAIDLGLRGVLDLKILGLGPRINFARYQLPLGGIGLTANLSHILGSHEPIEFDYKLSDFDEAKFGSVVEDLVDERADADEKKHEANLEQNPSTKPVDQPAQRTQLRKTFTMSGTPHTLWLEHNPGPVLKMASDGDGRLPETLRAEITPVEQQEATQTGDAKEVAAAESASARSMLAQAQAVEQGLAHLESEQRSADDVAGFSEIPAALFNYGAQFDKTDLATDPPPPLSTGVEIDGSGRYVIRNRADLEAVRAAKPPRPAQLDDEPNAVLEGYWNDYNKPDGYFDKALAAIDKDLTPPKRKVRHDPPLTWSAYIESRNFYGGLTRNKEFQAELRKSILAERGNIDPARAEIDVGLKKGRLQTRFADLVIIAPEGLEVYSLKVRNVTAQTFKPKADDATVRQWIYENLNSDVKDAIDYYGGKVNYRRPKTSDPATGQVDEKTGKRNPQYDQSLFVNRVFLVWKGNADLIPERFRDYIIATGNDLGAKYRKTISCEVRLQP